MTVADGLVDRRGDPVVADAFLMTSLMIALAGFGGIFWVIAGRLQTAEAVGIAGTLASALMVLAFAAQLGVDRSLLAALPHSDRPRHDFLFAVTVSATIGFGLGWLFAFVLPMVAADSSEALSGYRREAFGLFVAGTAVNITTDSALLALRRVGTNLTITGVLMGVLKCALPFVFVSAGAFGLAAAAGVASIVAAAICVGIVLHALPGGWGFRPSTSFRNARGLGFSTYVSTLIDLVPIMVIPILLLRAAGPEENGVYFIAFQVVMLLNGTALSIANSGFAEALRNPASSGAAMRRTAWVMAAIVGAGILVVIVAAPWLLAVFGDHYAETGVPTLRILALAALPVAFALWAAIALRLRGRLVYAVLVAVVCAGTTVGVTCLTAEGGTEAGAVSWLVGHAAGALLGVGLVWRSRVR